MTLQPGCRFAVAPRFHLRADWARRLLVGTGVEGADSFFPRGPWRPPTDDEMAHLIRSGESTPPEEPDPVVELFQLPEHLRAGWWQLLERAAGAVGSRLPGYDAFVARVVEFLAFKGLPVPDGASCDAVVSRPGQRSVRADPETGRQLGMSCSLFPRTPWPVPEGVRGPRLWGGINLGDEATSVVLINLPCRQMGAGLQRRFPDRSPAATVGELAERFLRARPDYPPVRLTLDPGEGYRLPEGGLIVDGSPESKREPDVLLLITDAGDGNRAPGAAPALTSAGEETMRCVGDGIWLTGRLLGPHECSALIASAEAEGFRSAHMKADGRNNSEVFFRLPDLADAILSRLRERVHGAGVDFEVVMVSPGFECYRYQEGDSVAAHRDAPVEVRPERQSDLSLVLYLNDGFQDGETSFPDQVLNLRPVTGEGVLFRHALLHEGTPVRQGRKYIVRTSVAVATTVPEPVARGT
jgi:prolyl 4-hydroxylase